MNYIYFKDSEFKKCNPPCSINDMDVKFMLLLDEVRANAKIPLVLNSAYRSKEWDLKHNRTGTGAHTYGMAVDIRCNTDANKYKIVKAAIDAGINRIGVYETFIHLDIADKVGKTKNVIWYGK